MELKSAGRVVGRILPTSASTRALWISVVAASAALLLLPDMVRLDGTKHADWLQFVGRFHPLAVHIPIGLIVLVPVLEIAGKFRPALREAASFVLGLAVAACLGTLVLGYLLAYGSGDTGVTVTRHMWGGIALAIGLMLCLLARSPWSGAANGYLYPVLLACVLFALVWTAHQGGTLTHGSAYLTEYMPAPLKRVSLFNNAVAAGDANSFYGRQIHPIFDANCVACHGASKMQGGLRLDSYELLMKGGKDGRVVIPGNAQGSVLLERVTLPPDNKHFMPAEGRPPLKPDETARIRAWIEQGASPASRTVAGVVVEERPKEAPTEPVGDYSALMPEIHQMAQAQGAKLLAVSAKPSDGLILTTVDVASNFGDAQLAQFQKFAPYIVEADLARTSVTDASFETLSKFTHLCALHLEGTAVTGRGFAKLAPLSRLTYLNLSETKVDSAAIVPLASMTNLRHLYLFDTPAQPATAGDTHTDERSAQ
jgi:mono/diheme cytochrome c family protein